MRAIPTILLLLAAAVTAQDRQPLLGRVVDERGEPAPGARLAFAWTSPEGDDFEAPDYVEAAADARGRFRADLAIGRGYSAWALAARADPRGITLASRVHEDLAPGMTVEFVLTLPRRERRLRVEHAAGWAERCGPLSLRVSPYARSLAAAAVPVASDGNAGVPPLAGESGYCELRDGRGRTLHRAELAADADAWSLPPPLPIPVRVVDEQGRPVAGVAVLHEVASFTSPAATLTAWPWRRQFRAGAITGEDGTAVVHVPCAATPFGARSAALVLLAQKAGFAEAASGWDGVRFEDGKEAQAEPGRLRFVLHQEQPVAGSVRGDAGPAAGLPVHLVATCAIDHGDYRASYEREWLVRTDAAGAFACGFVPAGARLDRVVAAPLPGRKEAGDARSRLPDLPALHPDDLERRDAIALAPARGRRLVLRVQDASGTPAAGALVQLFPLRADDHGYDDWRHLGRLDAAGRVAVQVMAGAWLVCVTDGQGFAHLVLDVDADGGEQTLRLAPLAEMRGQLLGADGRPPVAARLDVCDGGGPKPTQPPVDEVLDGVAFWFAVAAAGRTRPDAEGRFTLRFLERARVTARAVATAGTSTSPPFALQAGVEPVRIELQPARK